MTNAQAELSAPRIDSEAVTQPVSADEARVVRRPPIENARQETGALPSVFEMPASAVNQAVYVAIAANKDDSALDVLAGITYHTVRRTPGLSAEVLAQGVAALSAAIDASSPNRQFDHSPNACMYMSRILTRLAPRISDPVWRRGAKDYTRAFLGSYRQNVDQFRRLAAIDTQFDQFGEVDRFRRDTWSHLFTLAAANAPVAAAVDGSRIGGLLGVKTSDDAATMLARVPNPSLTAFFAAKVQPGGQVRAERADLEKTIRDISEQGRKLTDAWKDVLRELGLDKPKPELEQAIEKAKKRQKELDGFLGDVRAGTKGTLHVLAFLASKSNDPDFAKDIEKFSEVSVAVIDVVRKYSKGAITFAEKAAGLLKLGTTGFAVISGVGTVAGLVAVGFTIAGMFGKRPTPINEIILQQVKAISQQIRDLRAELQGRFDRIEHQLNDILDRMLEQFERINFELGQIEGTVEDIQLALYAVQSDLLRFNRNIHVFLEAAHRRDLVEAVNGFLDFRERTGQDLDLAAFLVAENEFFSWGFSHAHDPLQAGPVDRQFDDGSLLEELDALPLATNVNFLREMPARRFGLPALSTRRFANPTDWIAATEGYCQLAEEWPPHVANVSAERIQKMSAVGVSLGDGLARIADMSLFTALAEHYQARFASLKQALVEFEKQFRNDPANGLMGIDPWGGAHQIPDKHPLKGTVDLRRCDGRPFGAGVSTVKIALDALVRPEVAPYMIAHNRGLGVLDACISARWIKKSVQPIFGERFNVVFQDIVTVRIRFGGVAVFEHKFETDATFRRVLVRQELDTFNPNTVADPHASVDGLKGRLGSFPVTHTLVNPQLRTATIAAVEAALTLSQRAFYGQVAQKIEAAGDAVSDAAARLTGSKLLWQSFIVMGLPLSLESNEFLRSLLFGAEAIPAGSIRAAAMSCRTTSRISTGSSARCRTRCPARTSSARSTGSCTGAWRRCWPF